MSNAIPSGPITALARVPEELRRHDRWVCWRRETRDGKPTKVPYNPATGLRASSTDPRDWFPFDAAVGAAGEGGYDGVGFVFAEGEGFCGIDIDGCIGEDGRVSDGAREIIDALGSYAEVSPSGTGVKIFIRGVKPATAKCKRGRLAGFKAIEVYEHGRYFTVTGRHLEGTPLTVEDRQAALDALCARFWPPRPTTPTPPRAAATTAQGAFGTADPDDDRLLDRARHAANGAKFKALFDAGDTSGHGGDDSSADLALCSILWFWTGDADRVDRLFRQSKLYREKWDREDYRASTLAKAAEGEVYSPRLAAGGRVPPVTTESTTAVPGPDDPDGLIPLGQADPRTGRLVLSPRRTLPTAEAFVREFYTHADGPTLLHYAGSFWAWEGNRYRELEDQRLKQVVQPWLHDALRYVINKQTQLPELVAFESNPNATKQVIETLGPHIHIPITTPLPSWLDARRPSPHQHLNPAEILAGPSRSIHIPTGQVIPATPRFFTTTALEFDYDPGAESPERWIKFLEEVFGDDLEAVQALQDFMGYCLTPDTRQQKILLMVGPKRSGKGTIARVLARLVGLGNVANPTVGSLAGLFGLQPLLGKSVAIISDARFRGDGMAIVVERLLSISGEDGITVDIKHKPSVTTKLPTRFVILSNELPKLTDAAGALANRFIIVRMSRSFFGREDPGLTEALYAELPGILAWAIEGWKRLQARGRFVQPASAEEAVQELEDLSSPVAAFVRGRCVVGAGHRVDTDVLFRDYLGWCQAEGIDHAQTKPMFGRDLVAAFPQVQKSRGTDKVAFYKNITLQGDADVPV